LRLLERLGVPPLPQIGLRLYRAAAVLSLPAQRLHHIALEAVQVARQHRGEVIPTS
jgi:hypothetical protein